MKILHLAIKNLRAIKSFEIAVDPNVVMLNGKNGSGKSTVLDAVALAFRGGKMEAVRGMISHGEEKSEVVAVTEKWTVKRVFTKKSQRLEVLGRDAEGNPLHYASQQAMLNSVLGDLSFDPLGFMSAAPGAQAKVLLSMAGVDLEEYKGRCVAIYDERTVVNREVSRLQGKIDLMPTTAPGLPARETPVADVADSLRRGEENLDTWARQRDALAIEMNAANQAVDDTRDNARAAQEAYEDAMNAAAELKEQVNFHANRTPAPEVVADVEALRERLKTQEATNQAIRNAAARRESVAEIEKATCESERLTAELERLGAEQRSKLEQAELPLPGLAVEQGTVLFRGTPICELSMGEKIRVSTAVAIALNPTLRVIFVRDASLLDAEGKRIVMEMAAQSGHQVWMESVSDNAAPGGLHLVDGKLDQSDHGDEREH